LRAGGIGHYRYDGGATIWSVKDGDTAYELRLTPLHQPIGLWPAISADYARNIGGRHFEVADRLEGTISIKGATCRVKGYAYRDHSWGPRNWFNLKVHRWANGLAGDNFGFGFSNYMVDQPGVNRRGFIRLGSVVHYTREVDILPLMEADGTTHRGGVIHATLENGAVYRFDLVPFGLGNLGIKRDNCCYDSPCSFSFDGRRGIAMLEVSENARRGTASVDTLIGAPLGNGIFPARDLRAPYWLTKPV